jgi:hypothetical protein
MLTAAGLCLVLVVMQLVPEIRDLISSPKPAPGVSGSR